MNVNEKVKAISIYNFFPPMKKKYLCHFSAYPPSGWWSDMVQLDSLTHSKESFCWLVCLGSERTQIILKFIHYDLCRDIVLAHDCYHFQKCDSSVYPKQDIHSGEVRDVDGRSDSISSVRFVLTALNTYIFCSFRVLTILYVNVWRSTFTEFKHSYHRKHITLPCSSLLQSLSRVSIRLIRCCLLFE